MKKSLIFVMLMIVLTLHACTTITTSTPTPMNTPQPSAPSATLAPTQLPTSEQVQPTDRVMSTPGFNQYTNSQFGLSFQYPSNWFGPDEYISGGTLRVAVGSDVVYPYGEVPQQPSNVKNSYSIVVQYTKGDQNSVWQDTYQSLKNLKDGESISTARSKIIRVKQLEFGRLSGYEYISTLSDTAQTDPVYSREVLLVDALSDAFSVLTVSGSPTNVEVSEGTSWRAVYQGIDAANQAIFNGIAESITITN